MEGGKKVDIPLTSPIDVNSSDMLVPVDRAEFEHNRQKYQGRTLPSSLRFEADGWAAANDVYNFAADTGVINIEGTDWTARKFKLNNNAAYLIEIYDKDNKLIGNICINASNRIVNTTNIKAEDLQLTEDSNAIILSGTFNNHDWTLTHSYALTEVDGVYKPQFTFNNADEGALSCSVYTDDGEWRLAFPGVGVSDTFNKNSDYNTSGSGNILIRVYDNSTAEDIDIVVWQAATVQNQSTIEGQENYDIGYYVSTVKGNDLLIHTYNKGIINIHYNESFSNETDTVTVEGIETFDTSVLIDTQDNGIHFTFKQGIHPSVTITGSASDKSFFGIRNFADSNRNSSLVTDAASSDVFVPNDIEIDTQNANVITKNSLLKVKGSFPVWSELDITMPDAPFKVTSSNTKVLNNYIQAALPNSPVPEQTTEQTLSMLRIYHNDSYVPEPIYSHNSTPGIFDNVNSSNYVDPGISNSKWLPWSSGSNGFADSIVKAYGHLLPDNDAALFFDTDFFKYDLDIFLCDINPVTWARTSGVYVPDKTDMYYLALKSPTVNNSHTVDMKKSLYDNIKAWKDRFYGQIRADGTDASMQDNGQVLDTDMIFAGPVYSLDMRLNKAMQRLITDYHLNAQDATSFKYTTLGITTEDAPAFAVYAEKGTPDYDFTVNKDTIPLTETTTESNKIKLHAESYDFYKFDAEAIYGTDEEADPDEDPNAAISIKTGTETFSVTCNRQLATGYTEYIEYEVPDSGTSGGGTSGTSGVPVPVTRRIMQNFGPEIIVAVNAVNLSVTNKGQSTDPIIESVSDLPLVNKDVTLLRIPINKSILEYLCQSVFPKLWKYFIHYALKISPSYNTSVNPPQPLTEWSVKNFTVDDFTIEAFSKFVSEHLVFRVNNISINKDYIKQYQPASLPLDTAVTLHGIPVVDMSSSEYWIVEPVDTQELPYKAEYSYLDKEATPANNKAYAFYMAPCVHTLDKTCLFTVTHTNNEHIEYRLDPKPILPDGSFATHRAMLSFDVVEQETSGFRTPWFPSLFNTFKLFNERGVVTYSGEYGPDGTKPELQYKLPFFTRLEDNNYFNNFNGKYSDTEEVGLLYGSIWQQFMSSSIFTSEGFYIDLSGDKTVIQQGYGLLLPWLSQLEDDEVRVLYNGSGNKLWDASMPGPCSILWVKKIDKNKYKFFMFQRCMLKSNIKLQDNVYKDFKQLSFDSAIDSDYPAYTDLGSYMKKIGLPVTYAYAGFTAESELFIRSGAIGVANESSPVPLEDYVGWSGDGYPVVLFDLENTSVTDNEFTGDIFIKSIASLYKMTLVWPKATDSVNNTVNVDTLFSTDAEYSRLYHEKLYSNYKSNMATRYSAILSITAEYIMYRAFMQNITKSVTISGNDIDTHDFFNYLFPDFISSTVSEVTVTPPINTISNSEETLGKLVNPYQYIVCRFNNTTECLLFRFNREPVELNSEIGPTYEEYNGMYMALEFITSVTELTELLNVTGGERTVLSDGSVKYVFTSLSALVITHESDGAITDYVLKHIFDSSHVTTYTVLPQWDVSGLSTYYIAYRDSDKPYAMPESFVLNTEILYDCIGKVLKVINDNNPIKFDCSNAVISNMDNMVDSFTIDINNKVIKYKDDVFYVSSDDIDREHTKFNVSFTYMAWCNIVAILRGVYKYGNAFDGGN